MPLAPFPYAPERTHAEPAKQPRKTDRESHAPSSGLPRVIFGKFAEDGDHSDACQGQENKTGDFQPELPEYTAEM